MKLLGKILITMTFFQLVGCSQFMPHRSFLTEMENDDTSFYNPNQDFPVVAGDNGNFGISDEERRLRTPASEFDNAEQKSTLSLEEELNSLESQQPENALHFYHQHQHKLLTTSERIFFLNLPHNERHDYLDSRGMLEQEKGLYTKNEKAFAMRKADILLGMSKDDVMTSWGQPSRTEIAGNPSNENERWLYKPDGASRYIYFESGRVEGWE